MNITLYCSARQSAVERYAAHIEPIADFIGKEKHRLIYGGVGFGLMKVMAEHVADAGGEVIGILPERRRLDECRANHVTMHVATLDERKSQMIDMADVFLVLPGGYGTLDELLTTFSHLTFNNDTARRIIILNLDKIYDDTISQLKTMASFGLFEQAHLHRIIIADNANECVKHLSEISKTI